MKANQSDLEALEAVVATKANQVLVDSLSTEVAGKQSQLRAGYEEGSHPLLVGTSTSFFRTPSGH